ncbi:MAG: zinc-ribbon domain-containing protein [Myxococcales bacterium]|nr:zinc-ribbon domain-containing protein [Myxococcales bacterium]
MLVQCPQCSAAYEFPAERLPPGGLRAKCARCGCVMRVRPPAADGRAQVEASPKLTRRPGRALEGAAAGTARRSENRSVPPPEVFDTTRPATSDEDDEPSIIIDMTQLNTAGEVAPEAPEAPAPAPSIEATALTAAPPAAAFAPFHADAPDPRRRVRAESFPIDSPVDPELVASLRTGPRARTIVAFVALLAVGFAVFVAWRNDFGPIWQNPGAAIRHAFGQPAEAGPAPLDPVVQNATLGELVIRRIELSWVDRQAVLVHGVVVNESDRIQRAIGIEVAVMEAGLALRSRVVPCCADMTPEEARKIARDPRNPHFDEDQAPGDVALTPGESRTFAVVLRDLSAASRDDVQPRARIRYSEADRVTVER